MLHIGSVPYRGFGYRAMKRKTYYCIYLVHTFGAYLPEEDTNKATDNHSLPAAFRSVEHTRLELVTS